MNQLFNIKVRSVCNSEHNMPCNIDTTCLKATAIVSDNGIFQ
jgi:hypothetical protein